LQNLLSAPDTLPEELTEILARSRTVRVERIVSHGHVTPAGQWYDQDEHEWVAVLTGRARLSFDAGDVVELGPGDALLIPARQRHRVEWTSPHTHTVWLAVFFTPDD
jgi:cupin 2 domain-containing protein